MGQTRSSALIRRLEEEGLGECVCPEEWPPRRRPFFLDNGAFRAWRAGRPFDEVAFTRTLALAAGADFVVAPDVVAGGAASLDLSRSWLHRLDGRVYLAVQDGMDPGVDLAGFDGVFVGGTLPWKLARGAEWVEAAHRAGRPCHIGRVGTPRRVAWARAIGADSIDSCLPLWSSGQLESFLAALRSTQLSLF